MSRDVSWLAMLDSSNSSNIDTSLDSKRSDPPSIIVEDCDSSRSRELEIEFADSKNEKKFDKLQAEKKLKSPFKRHLSNEKLSGDFIPFNDQVEKKLKLEDGQSPQKRLRKDSSESSSTGSSHQAREFETDKGILTRRQKQIDFGKNTNGYDNYIATVPRIERTREHPKTPPKNLKYSRRAWDGLIRSWRKKLHNFDPSHNENQSEDE